MLGRKRKDWVNFALQDRGKSGVKKEKRGIGRAGKEGREGFWGDEGERGKREEKVLGEMRESGTRGKRRFGGDEEEQKA